MTDWFYSQETLTGSYVKVDLGLKAEAVKLKASNTATFSWDGVADAGVVVAADGVQEFKPISKSHIYVKGTGTLDITGWSAP